jgi:hypothetical protein
MGKIEHGKKPAIYKQCYVDGGGTPPPPPPLKRNLDRDSFRKHEHEPVIDGECGGRVL